MIIFVWFNAKRKELLNIRKQFKQIKKRVLKIIIIQFKDIVKDKNDIKFNTKGGNKNFSSLWLLLKMILKNKVKDNASKEMDRLANASKPLLRFFHTVHSTLQLLLFIHSKFQELWFYWCNNLRLRATGNFLCFAMLKFDTRQQQSARGRQVVCLWFPSICASLRKQDVEAIIRAMANIPYQTQANEIVCSLLHSFPEIIMKRLTHFEIER